MKKYYLKKYQNLMILYLNLKIFIEYEHNNKDANIYDI